MYFIFNQEQFQRIGDLTWWQILLIVLGQSIVVVSNIFILIIFVWFVQKKIPFIDAARITAYSSLVNFFGFLQGGVGLRGIYLKRHYTMPFKRYIALTSIQYLLLFGVSGILLLVGIWLTMGFSTAFILVVGGALVAGLILFVLYQRKVTFFIKFIDRIKNLSTVFQAKPLLLITLLIVMQLCGSLLANGVELAAIGADITIGGLLTYTGISQFAIVIAITPGAIGIREALLLIVQNQMHLTTEDIVLAATIDRVVYFITLALMAPLALTAKKKLRKDIQAEVSASSEASRKS